MTPRPATPPPAERVRESAFLSWREAKHIKRVKEQREKRATKPPPRKKKLYKCKPCERSFPALSQLRIHLESKPHKNLVSRLEFQRKGVTCHLCDIKFDRESNWLSHIKSKRHRAAKRRDTEELFGSET